MDHTSNQSPQLTACPECGAPAEITRRMVLESTDGPIEHAAVRCVVTHSFLLPTAHLDRVAARTTTTGAASRPAVDTAAPVEPW